jgi:hypothetical protein
MFKIKWAVGKEDVLLFVIDILNMNVPKRFEVFERTWELATTKGGICLQDIAKPEKVSSKGGNFC